MDLADGSDMEELLIDGSHGEGGGQILRTACSLSAITGRAIRVDEIRAGRRNPGLAAQHVTAIRAVGAICNARIEGDELGSQTLRFAPQSDIEAGDYHFDVADAREGGSAGSVCLVLQAVLLPMAFADGASTVTVDGGTHVPWCPSFDYLNDVWLPALSGLGIDPRLDLVRPGWYPAGEGEVRASIDGLGAAAARPASGLTIVDRGPLERVTGRAIASSLPAHIAQRMSDRARALLEPLDVPVTIQARRMRSTSPGAGIYIAARYENISCGFDGAGRRGLPSEAVAEHAVAKLLDHHETGAALDEHLADQILLPLAFADEPSEFSCRSVTRHLETNAWVIERFGLARVAIDREPDGTGRVTVVAAP